MEFKELREKIELQEKWLLRNVDNPKIEDFFIKFKETLDKFNDCIMRLEKELGRDLTDEEIEEGEICSCI